MPVSTAVRSPRPRPEVPIQAPVPALEAASWRWRYLFSGFRDRRSLHQVGGLGAYLSQVGWSIWWALRR